MGARQRRGDGRKPIAAAFALALALSGCMTVSPRERVYQKLVEAGMKPRLADCMAEKLVRKLSIAQLKELARVAKLPHKDVGRLSFAELADRLQAVNDPHIVEVVTRAGIGCAIAG
jgi:hypothetical protein